MRVGRHADVVYIDLGTPDWSAVEIDAGGWRIVLDPPVHFRRTRGARPLPIPVAGGSIDDLRPFVNIADDDDFRLLLSAIVAMLYPDGPYPVLPLVGEQGSAKSTTADVVRALVDPRTAARRAPPGSERDLMIAATNGWLLTFDNLSHIPSWQSDALCRLSTGGGLTTRELYTNAEEVVFDAMRPVVLNGIEDLAGRPDLLDRSIALTLPNINDADRRDEREFWAAFEAMRPRIFGVLLTALVLVIRDAEHLDLHALPRMADFARRAAAAAPALGWTAEDFLAAYARNRLGADQTALEGSLIAAHIEALMAAAATWEGTATELLATLTGQAPEAVARQRAWPRTARSLAGHLRRLAPNLRRAGIDVSYARDGRKRRIHLAVSTSLWPETAGPLHPALASPPSLASPTGHPPPGGAGPRGDANGAIGAAADDLASPPAVAANLMGDGSDANDANAGRERFRL